MRYVVSMLYKHNAETAYRVYISDALQALTENTAHLSGSGKVMPNRWYDIMYPKPEKVIEEDTRSCKEITISVWKNMMRKEDK